MPNKGLFFNCLVCLHLGQKISQTERSGQHGASRYTAHSGEPGLRAPSLCVGFARAVAPGQRASEDSETVRNIDFSQRVPSCWETIRTQTGLPPITSIPPQDFAFLLLLLTQTSLELSLRHLFSGILLGSPYFLLVPDRVILLAFPVECLGKSGPALLLGCISGSRHAHCCLCVCGQSFSSSSYEEEAAKAKGTGKPAAGEPVPGSKQI